MALVKPGQTRPDDRLWLLLIHLTDVFSGAILPPLQVDAKGYSSQSKRSHPDESTEAAGLLRELLSDIALLVGEDLVHVVVDETTAMECLLRAARNQRN